VSWDVRSERISARAQAERAHAEAEAIRVQAENERRRVDAELEDQRAESRRIRARERRQAFAEAVRRHSDLALPVLAVGSPALIAWRGQFEFALEKMKLGVMAPLLPVAIEGSVLYSAFLTHKAVAQGLPAGRYRALTWALAGVAAGMNFWHGHAKGSDEVGVALALTSLLSIVLLELTAALRKAREGQARTGRGAAEIRRALIRRLRYPRLSLQAAAIAAARGIDAEDAWRAAWVDRYGVGPETTRSERRTARVVMAREQRAARRSARRGGLTIADGQVVPAAWFDDADEQPGRSPMSNREHPGLGAGEQGDEHSGPWREETPDVRETVARELGRDLVTGLERYLDAQAQGPGGLRELPPAQDGPHEPAAYERLGEHWSGRSTAAHGDGGELDAEQVSEQSREGAGKRRRGSRRKSASRAARKRDRREHGDRLEKVRRVLAEQPDLCSAQISEQTGIPHSTARRLAKRIRDEQADGGER
jgi:hypothetical protein